MKSSRLAAGLLRLAAVTSLTTVPHAAQAFCGFYVGGADQKMYNNATQVVLMREGTRTVLSMQNNYDGPPTGFAMVVPVPVVFQKENVKTLTKETLAHIDQLAAPRLVEYWEQDPCYQPPRYPHAPRAMKAALAEMEAAGAAPHADYGVKVEAKFAVGEYEIVILSAKDSGGLERWLTDQHYAIPAGAGTYLQPYVQAGSKFFVAKVDPSKVTFAGGRTELSPLRFHYDSETFSLPVRLGLMSSKGEQDLIVHILAKGQRYEVANYQNVSIPTNFDVADKTKQSFGSFYATLFDETLKRHPKSVVTEYSWDASTCDPCPGPPLDQNDFQVLGGDVMPRDDESRGYYGGYVVTRLHARYNKESLGEDLVFRAAPPIVGGREHVTDGKGKLEQGARPDSVNNFQARYAVRHPWTGPIQCKNPRRGIWGGPPHGGGQRPVPALDLAFTQRAGDARSFAARGAQLPEASLLGMPASVPGMIAGGVLAVPAEPPSDPALDAGLTPTETDAGPDDATPPLPQPEPHGGCASCSTSEQGGAGGALAFLAIGLAWLARRTRR